MKYPPTDKTPKPASEAAFVEWAQKAIAPEFGTAFRGYYESKIAAVLLSVQQHEFFVGLDREIDAWNAAEKDATGSQLLMQRQVLELQRKPFQSVVNKCYRRNVIRNEDFPSPPKGGWIEPKNVFGRINDLIRGTLVCRYADGPEKLAVHLKGQAEKLGLDSWFYSQGREDGYYAFHFYVKVPVELYDFNHVPRNEAVAVEVQITTQLQDVLRQFTHEIYEQNRDTRRRENGEWKWQLNSHRFRAGYLSHTLHLLEAIVVQLRDDARSGKGE